MNNSFFNNQDNETEENKTQNKKSEKSSVAKMLDISAYLMYIVGFLSGFTCFVADFDGHIIIGITCWLTGFILASLIFALSEIIYYLIDIKTLLKKQKR